MNAEFTGDWSRKVRWEYYIANDYPTLSLCTAISVVGLLDLTKVLLVHHKVRGWTFPGGHIENDETISEAVQRETLEETGAIISNCQMIGFQKVIHSEPEKHRSGKGYYPFPFSYIPHFLVEIEKENESEILDINISEYQLLNPNEALNYFASHSKEYLLLMLLINSCSK